MADDIVAIGGSKPGAAERFEALFRAEYEHLAAASETSEQVQRTFLRLWHRRWLVRDLQAVTRDLRGDTPSPVHAPGAVDVDRAWQVFQALRARGRHRLLVTAAALAIGAVVAAAVPVLAGRLASGQPPRPFWPVVQRPPRIPPSDPAAIAARIPVSDILMLTAAGGQVWAIRELATRRGVQLVQIDSTTDRIGLRARLAWQPASITAGAGMVWLATPFGRQRGQVQRFNAATGRPAGPLHLPAGKCPQVSYGAGSLWASCQAGHAIRFLRIDAGTGRVTWRSVPTRWQYQYGPVLGPMTAAPGGLWYASGSGVAGFVGRGMRRVTVRPPRYTINLRSTTALVYSEGFVWAMAGDDGSVAKIDPATGRMLRIYTFTRYALGQGLSLAVAQGSLWLLDNGDFAYPSVLRVSITTGLPTGRVGGRRLCGFGNIGQCWQIYATPGAIWVPAANWLARIDPGRLRPRWHPEP